MGRPKQAPTSDHSVFCSQLLWYLRQQRWYCSFTIGIHSNQAVERSYISHSLWAGWWLWFDRVVDAIYCSKGFRYLEVYPTLMHKEGAWAATRRRKINDDDFIAARRARRKTLAQDGAKVKDYVNSRDASPHGINEEFVKRSDPIESNRTWWEDRLCRF